MQQNFKFSNKVHFFFDIEKHPNPSEPHKITDYVYCAAIYKILPDSTLLIHNASHLSLLDLDESFLSNKDFIDMLSGSQPYLFNSNPISHNYSGHQFGTYVGQLGDGRSITIGDYINANSEKWEINLKGTGKTAFSREADGRSMLRSCLKEFLYCEYMHKLGIPTPKALLVFGSFKELVERDLIFEGTQNLEPAGIICRIAHNFIRFGSFELLLEQRLFQGDGWKSQKIIINLLKSMMDFVIEYDFKTINLNDPKKYELFYQEVVKRTAKLAALWQTYGFCHGALNTDNMSILGLTLDYETSGFMEVYNPDFNSNSMDYSGRHCFKEQPGILAWNLVKLAEALKMVSDFNDNINFLKKEYVLIFQNEYQMKMRERMGFFKNETEDITIFNSFLKILLNSKSDYTKAFRWLCFLEFPINFEKNRTEIQAFSKEALNTENMENWIKFLKDYELRLAKEEITHQDRKERMIKINPSFVLRADELKSAFESVLNEKYDINQTLNIHTKIVNLFI